MKDGTKGWTAGALKKRAGRWRVTSQRHPPPRAVSPPCLFSIVIFFSSSSTTQGIPECTGQGPSSVTASISMVTDHFHACIDPSLTSLYWVHASVPTSCSPNFHCSNNQRLLETLVILFWRTFEIGKSSLISEQASSHIVRGSNASWEGLTRCNTSSSSSSYRVQEFPRMGSRKSIYLSRNTTVTLSMKLCMKCIIMNILMFIVCYDQ